jgi:hypothetical protein
VDGVTRIRIGDTVLSLVDAEPDLIDRLVHIRVTDFDDAGATGRAELLAVVDGE